eukprot:2554223-Pleurochrysis_carterae.AAC.5
MKTVATRAAEGRVAAGRAAVSAQGASTVVMESAAESAASTELPAAAEAAAPHAPTPAQTASAADAVTTVARVRVASLLAGVIIPAGQGRERLASPLYRD